MKRDLPVFSWHTALLMMTQIIFIILKVTDSVTWEWEWVMAPVWVIPAAVFVIFSGYILVTFLMRVIFNL